MRSVDLERTEALVKDLSPSPRGPSVVVDHGLAYELVLSLRMWVDVEDPSSYAEGPAWFDRVRGLASRSLVADIDRYAGGHELLFGHLLGIVVDAESPKDSPSLIARLTKLDPMALRRHLLGYHLQTYRGGVSRNVIARAARDDRDAVEILLAGSDEEHSRAYRHALSLAPAETKDLLVGILEGWSDAVMQPWAETISLLARSAAHVGRLAQELAFDRLLDVLSPGCRYDPEPGIDRVLLVPSRVGRPWLVMCEHDGAKIFCFPADDGGQDDLDLPPGLVALYRALGEESRLRLLRRLVAGPSTFQELTEHLGLAKSTVHGHLLALRTSGLVTLDIVDRRYAIRRGALDAADVQLETYLRGEPS